ncbi:MAG: hypothetical protein AAFQ54_00140 [Pseudomonadota bacterium]
MTTRLAIIIFALILAAIAIDAALLGGEATVFLIRRVLDLIEWVAFWR